MLLLYKEGVSKIAVSTHMIGTRSNDWGTIANSYHAANRIRTCDLWFNNQHSTNHILSYGGKRTRRDSNACPPWRKPGALPTEILVLYKLLERTGWDLNPSRRETLLEMEYQILHDCPCYTTGAH